MKTILPAPASLLIALALSSWNIQADESNGSRTNQSEIRLEAKIVLTATTNAPAGASGIAKLKSKIVDGVPESTLKLKVSGLASGEYLLSIMTQPNGTTNMMTNILGQFTVGGADDDDDRTGHSHSRDSHSHTGNSRDDSDIREQGHSHTSRSEEDDDQDDDYDRYDGDGRESGDITEIKIDLPSEINPLDIRQVTVSDTAGNTVLAGDLLSPNPVSTLRFRGLITVSAGEAAPSARGKAHVYGQIRKGRQQTRFTLVASQVPAEATYHVMVNGRAVGTTVRSSRKGRVIVKKLPSQQFPVRSVELIDTQGNCAVITSF